MVINLSSEKLPKADMVVTGEIESKFNNSSDLDLFKDSFLRDLFDTRSKDSFRGITSIGPHRAELEVRYQEKERLANLCSTGEQKSLLISIIVANESDVL